MKKRRTRAAIQEHAVRLFTEQGYDATTVEQIAAAAEISPATFFRYFKTKEDVVIEDDYDPMMVAALEAAPADLPPLRALRYALTGIYRQIPEAEKRQVFERTKLIMSVPALRARSLDNMVATIDFMAPPLARRLGRPENDVGVRTFVGAVIGAWLAVFLEWIASDGALDLADLMDEALTALETGLS
jgi:AcrR family transcriptional regulator